MSTFVLSWPKKSARVGLFAAPAALAVLFLALFSLCGCEPPRSRARETAPARGLEPATTPLRVISLAPSCTAILAGLGKADVLIAVDSWSADRAGVPTGIPRFDMMRPDAERLLALDPDLLLVSTMTREGSGIDPFAPLSSAGIAVAYLPTSASLADVRADIARIAGLVGAEDGGDALIAKMDAGIAGIRLIADAIPKERRRTVVFELSPAPAIYSFGSGVYLDEILAAAGAINALGGEKGWIAVSAETLVALDPDVILTNVAFLDDPVAEIRSRPGWAGIKAVRSGRVYRIDNAASSQPAPDLVFALREIAEAVYPEYFKE